MTSASYQLQFDSGRNATYGNAAIDDLSNYIVSMQWNEGIGSAYDEIAPSAVLNVVLRNINGEFTSEAVSSELILNGSFANWTADNPDSWTVTGESGTDPQVSQTASTVGHGGGGSGACNIFTSSSTVSIAQTPLIIGQTYRVTLDMTFISGTGAVQLMCGSTRIAPPIWATGTYIFYFNANSSTFKIQNWYACNVTIDNVSVVQTALYKPLLKRGTLGRLKVTSGSTVTMFTGRLKSKTPTPGQASARRITLEFTDPMEDLKWGDYRPTLAQSVTVDQAIQPVFDKAVIAFPYTHSYWMLGVAGASELGETTTLFSTSAYALDTGYTTLDFVGDNADTSGTGIAPLAFITEEVRAEGGGRFFFDPRQGKYTFHNRNRDLLNTTVVATISETDFESDRSLITSGNDLENQTTISFQPRKIGTPGTVIWTASNLPVSIAVGDTYTTTARFQDQSNGNARMGAKDVLMPTAGVDYILTTGGALAYTFTSVGCIISATTAEFHFTNNRLARSLTFLQLRGTPITFYDPKSITSINAESIRDNVLATNMLSIPAISNETFAKSYADYRVHKFGDPSTRYERIFFYANNSAARMSNMLNLTVGSRVTLTESWTGHNADYIVVGAAHSVMMGGDNEHQTTLVLKPQSREVFWVLGITNYSELGTHTRVAF